MGPVHENSLELRVSDLMHAESCDWDLRKIQLYLPEYEEKIQGIKPKQTGAPDKLIWLGTKSGEYSTKSGYYTAVDRAEDRDGLWNGTDINWKKNVWKLECAPKIKLFSWKMLKGALPVGERLNQRHVPVDPLCKRCGDYESITHLFFQCSYARKVWSLAPFVSEVECSVMVDLAASWGSLCARPWLPPAGVTSDALAPWILWNLWKARNKLVFEGRSDSSEDTFIDFDISSKRVVLKSEERTLCPFQTGEEPAPRTVTRWYGSYQIGCSMETSRDGSGLRMGGPFS